METPKKRGSQQTVSSPASRKGPSTRTPSSPSAARTPRGNRIVPKHESPKTPAIKQDPAEKEMTEKAARQDHDTGSDEEAVEDPGAALAAFDWAALLHEHEQKLSELDGQEEAIREEFESLLQVI
jgi:hypothetical protein